MSLTKQRSVKKNIDQESARRGRTDAQFEIRKSKKEEQLNKRRSNVGDQVGGRMLSGSDIDQDTMGVTVIPPALLEQHCKGIYSGIPEEQLKATQQFRRLLSIEKTPPIQQVIDCGIVPTLVEFLSYDHLHNLQFEAAWALTNIASGTSEHTTVVIDAGAVPQFIRLLLSPSDDVREQAAWALGNIAGDSVRCRDYVLSCNALPVLIEVIRTFNEHSRLSTIRNVTWTLSNFCRSKPAPNFAVVSTALPYLATLVRASDLETIMDACWALSYLSDGPNDRIQAVLNTGVAPRLVELLCHKVSTVQTPALRTVGNIVTGDDAQTQYMLNLNVLPALLVLLDHSKKNIRKECCWTLSNITAGNSEQIGMVVKAGIFPKLIQMLRASEYEIQKEAAWAISNATSGGTPEQLLFLANQGTIPPLCDLLTAAEPKIINVALEGIENILKASMVVTREHPDGNMLGVITNIIEECGGLGKIEQLQSHESQPIFDKCVKILETYFGAEEVPNDSMNTMGFPAAPNMQQNQGQYNFPPPAAPFGGQQYSFGAPQGNTQYSFGNPPNPGFGQGRGF